MKYLPDVLGFAALHFIVTMICGFFAAISGNKVLQVIVNIILFPLNVLPTAKSDAVKNGEFVLLCIAWGILWVSIAARFAPYLLLYLIEKQIRASTVR